MIITFHLSPKTLVLSNTVIFNSGCYELLLQCYRFSSLSRAMGLISLILFVFINIGKTNGLKWFLCLFVLGFSSQRDLVVSTRSTTRATYVNSEKLIPSVTSIPSESSTSDIGENSLLSYIFLTFIGALRVLLSFQDGVRRSRLPWILICPSEQC